jgi:hypothetical protein
MSAAQRASLAQQLDNFVMSRNQFQSNALLCRATPAELSAR